MRRRLAPSDRGVDVCLCSALAHAAKLGPVVTTSNEKDCVELHGVLIKASRFCRPCGSACFFPCGPAPLPNRGSSTRVPMRVAPGARRRSSVALPLVSAFRRCTCAVTVRARWGGWGALRLRGHATRVQGRRPSEGAMCCGTPSPSFSQEAWKAARLRDKSANPASSWGTHHFEGGGLGQHAALVVAVQRAGNLLLQHWAWGACGNVVMYSCGNVVT